MKILFMRNIWIIILTLLFKMYLCKETQKEASKVETINWSQLFGYLQQGTLLEQ